MSAFQPGSSGAESDGVRGSAAVAGSGGTCSCPIVSIELSASNTMRFMPDEIVLNAVERDFDADRATALPVAGADHNLQ